MILLVTNKSIMRSKLANNAFLNFNLMIATSFDLLFDLMKFELQTLSHFKICIYLKKEVDRSQFKEERQIESQE